MRDDRVCIPASRRPSCCRSRPGVAWSRDSCPAGTPFSGPIGERGGTHSGELRAPYDIADVDSVAAGRQLVMRALADTDSAERIREDEFELVQLGEHRYLVVLPGVIDLSSPGRGLKPEHRSVRDLDQHALPSSRSADVADNAYAQMVWSALLARGVPAGSQLVIVGHSFGADTALDLAADPDFNGADGGFDVTHVVASGYNSGPQLEHVPSSTQVLVLQNRQDAVIVGEAIGEAHVTDLGYAVGDVGEGLLDFDLPKVVSGTARAAWHEIGAEVAAVSHVVSRADDVLGGDLAALVTLEPGIDTPTASQVVAVFDGGSEGFGHHQDNYVDFIGETSDPAVTAFLASLAGMTAIGTAIAVDVSVPEPDVAGPDDDDDS